MRKEEKERPHLSWLKLGVGRGREVERASLDEKLRRLLELYRWELEIWTWL